MAVLFISCEDILEEDISNDVVQMIFPLNNQEIYSNIVHFQWQELDGADKYRIQIFNTNAGVEIDSLVTTTNFNYPMAQGDYQWRVRGENSAYQSNYTFNTNFSVFETDDLTSQQVVLTSPTDNFYTNNTSLILNWQALNAADSYSFELVNVTNGQTIVNQQTGLTITSLTLSNSILQTNAQYQWKIKAINTTSQSVYSSRNFYLDTNAPNTPTNLMPTNNTSVNANQQVDFTWSIPEDYGAIQSSISYTIEFSTTIGFASILQSSDITSTSFQTTFVTTGDYYWRVKAKDVAGNVSLASNIFKFTVN